MNLASFVDTTQSYDEFYALLEHIFSIYDGTIKTNTSVLIVSGDVNSGKTTMVSLLCEVSALNYVKLISSDMKDLPFSFVSKEWVLNYPNSGALSSISKFDREIIGCQHFFTADTQSCLKCIKKIHNAINNGITYRQPYKDDYTISNPATLILDVYSQSPLVFEFDKNIKRNIKQIFLSNKFLTHDSRIKTKCLAEIREIWHVLFGLDMWLRFKLLWLNHFPFVADISTHFLNIFPSDGLSVVTKDWWKVILGYKSL